MPILNSLLRNLGERIRGKRSWTPAEVHDLIADGHLEEAAAATLNLAELTPQRELASLCLRGEIAFRRHLDTEAEDLFRQALGLAPGHGDAHYGLSLVMLARGEKEPALRHAQFAVNSSNSVRSSAQLGLCHLEFGNVAQAIAALERAVRLDPRDKASWNNLGIAHRSRQDAGRARRAFQRALEIDPAFEAARRNAQQLEQEIATLGLTEETRARATPSHAPADTDARLDAVHEIARQGDFDAAINACEDLCLSDPDHATAVIELYSLYRERGDTQSGIDAMRAFLARHPEDLDVLSALGCALVAEREFEAARPLLEAALSKRPDDVKLLMSTAAVLEDEGRHAEAGTFIDRAVELDGSFDIRGHRAANLVVRCRYEEALALADALVAERGSAEESLAGIRVYCLTHLGRHDEALPIVNHSIAQYPHEPNRRFPRATIHLLNERFAEGWDDYAYRSLSSTKHLRMLPFPQWAGEPLAGKTILVLADQGLGDQVMFSSCLPDLLREGAARTIVEVNGRMSKTIARSFPACEVISSRQDNSFDWVRALGQIDYFIPIGDLPQRFRRRLEDFPAHRGFLQADPARVASWRAELRRASGGRLIGVSWRGGAEATRKVLRTMAVTELKPLAADPADTLVCLQYGDVSADLAAAEAAGLRMLYWPEAIKDLDEFAALVAALDLVITVCNTTVHYAGALNRPVWVMAPRVPEWRYGLRFTRMPWYPSSRMYRQRRDGDWTEVVDRVCRDLSLVSAAPVANDLPADDK